MALLSLSALLLLLAFLFPLLALVLLASFVGRGAPRGRLTAAFTSALTAPSCATRASAARRSACRQTRLRH